MADENVLACCQLQIQAHARGEVLAQVDAAMAPGRVTAIIGPNGAGKSSLMGHLAGLTTPRSGCVLLGTTPILHMAPAQRGLRMALMAQDTQVAFAFLVQEVVEMGRYPHRSAPDAQEAAIVQAAMALTGVVHLSERVVSSLSGGERARVHLARALAQGWQPRPDGLARWLLLDEPTAALDLQHQHLCMQLLQQRAHSQGVGVVAVLHDLNLALRYADDVLLVPGQGHAAVFGPTYAVLTAQRIAQTWQVHGEMLTMGDGTMQFLFAQGGVAQI